MTDLIRYDLLAQDALRGVVRKVLADAAKGGLPGDHHFFIEFNFDAPGVRISERLRQQQLKKSPDGHFMTIVLQHQFWDLVVTEKYFEIGLSFGGVPAPSPRAQLGPPAPPSRGPGVVGPNSFGQFAKIVQGHADASWLSALHAWWLRHGYYPEDAARLGQVGHGSSRGRLAGTPRGTRPSLDTSTRS